MLFRNDPCTCRNPNSSSLYQRTLVLYAQRLYMRSGLSRLDSPDWCRTFPRLIYFPFIPLLICTPEALEDFSRPTRRDLRSRCKRIRDIFLGTFGSNSTKTLLLFRSSREEK